MDSFIKIIETEYILMPTWKWLCLVLLLMLFPFVRRSMELFLKKIKNNHFFLQNKNIYVAEFSKANIEHPLSWIFALMLFILFVDVSEFPKNIDKYGTLIAQILIGFRWLQLLIISIDVVSIRWSQSFTDPNDQTNQIIPFAVKTTKLVLIVLGILITLQNLGINVVSVLAGLGIGGLAIALAGQETVSNLFGSLTILVDKPFQLHDHIKVLDVEGNVIEIGFRSTKILTPTNSIVTISNSVVAKEKLENLTLRQKRRIRHTITIAYDTSLDSIRSFMDEIHYYLKNHALVDQSDVTVTINNLNSSSIDILVNFFVNTQEGKIELETQHSFLMHVLATAEKLKVEIAYPTQKVFLKNI
jgi:MscS family membrane protein